MTSSPKASPIRLRAGASVLSVLAALLVCFVGVALLRGGLWAAGEAYLEMLWGGLGDFPRLFAGGPLSVLTRPWGESSTRAALLILTGLSVMVAFSVGLFNVGAQGQLLWGALAAAVVGAKLPLPPILHPLVCLLVAAAAGAAWALPAAALKLWRGVHEVITTIMLNWVALSLVENWLVVGPLRATSLEGASRSGTDEILPTAQLTRLLDDGSRLHVGFFLVLLIGFGVWLWLFRTRQGFESRAAGLGREAARASGIAVEARTLQAMALSGALAGMAGALIVLGTELKYPPSIAAPYGFDGIAISLIGQNHPVGVVVSALTFGALRAGGSRMQLLGVHRSLPELIQGLALLFVAAPWVWQVVLSRRRRSKRGTADA